MPITTTIAKQTWDDIVARKTGNPLAEDAIIKMASEGNVLVREGDAYFLPSGTGKITLVRVLPASEVPQFLSVAAPDSQRLLLKAHPKVAATWVRGLMQENLYSIGELEQALYALAKTRGLSSDRAALMLGLTRSSFAVVSDRIRYAGPNRFLPEFLEVFRQQYLPRDKIWGTQTSLSEDFVASYNLIANRERQPQLELQRCDMESCGHVATDQCANAQCRPEQEPRYVCPAHERWTEGRRPITEKPDVLCPHCEVLARQGQIPFRLL